MMRATVVVDNIQQDGVSGEWGLCIYIERDGRRFLLDAGASGLFAENAPKLCIELEDVDYAVLSHAHYDHANGMKAFFEKNSKASFWLQEDCGEDCYWKQWIFRKYIGIPKHILTDYRDRICLVKGKTQLCEGVYLLSHTTPGLESIGKREKMYRRKKDGWFPDNFSHEQSLVFETERGLVIFNSCSHGGAVNIIHEAEQAFPGEKVYGLIGGFHLFNKPESEIREVGRLIRETGIGYVCTGHCTKGRAYGILKQELGDVLHQLHVGLVMEL